MHSMCVIYDMCIVLILYYIIVIVLIVRTISNINRSRCMLWGYVDNLGMLLVD